MTPKFLKHTQVYHNRDGIKFLAMWENNLSNVLNSLLLLFGSFDFSTLNHGFSKIGKHLYLYNICYNVQLCPYQSVSTSWLKVAGGQDTVLVIFLHTSSKKLIQCLV